MGGEATTSVVGSSDSCPSACTQWNTRVWTETSISSSLRSVRVPEAAGAFNSNSTGSIWSNAAEAVPATSIEVASIAIR